MTSGKGRPRSATVIRFPVERRRDPTALELLEAICEAVRKLGSPRFRMTIRIEAIDDDERRPR